MQSDSTIYTDNTVRESTGTEQSMAENLNGIEFVSSKKRMRRANGDKDEFL